MTSITFVNSFFFKFNNFSYQITKHLIFYNILRKVTLVSSQIQRLRVFFEIIYLLFNPIPKTYSIGCYIIIICYTHIVQQWIIIFLNNENTIKKNFFFSPAMMLSHTKHILYEKMKNFWLEGVRFTFLFFLLFFFFLTI